MRLSKKAMAVLMGLTLTTGIGSTAFAASADSFTDVPKDHWAYQALDYLAQEGVIDGMGDSTFQGGRTMTRYEMASIVAKAMQKKDISFGDKAVLDKLSAEYAGELDTLNKKVDANTKAIKDLNEKTDKFKVWGMARVQAGDDNGLVKDGHNGDYNNRFYMDLEGSMKVNPYATARFTIEKNARTRDSEYSTLKTGDVRWVKHKKADGTYEWAERPIVYDKTISAETRDSEQADANHNGSISNIWVELALGKQHNWYTNIGRKWNGIGMQNLLLGGQIDGIATYHPIEKGHGWWFSAQYFKPSADWSQDQQIEVDDNGKVISVDRYTHRAPVAAAVDFWGPLGKYMDANIAYARVVGHELEHNDGNLGFYTGAKNFISADLKIRPFKDFSVTGSYVKSDAKYDWMKSYAGFAKFDTDWAVRMEYKGTDLNKVKSWGLYAKWVNLGVAADLGHDDEWATREPTFVSGVKGWYFGFKMVPWKNCEWETMWAPHLTENTNGRNTDTGERTAYKRHILRTWVDFHF